MKHFNSILVAALIILSAGVVNAQDSDNPWAIEVGVNAVDVYPVGLRDGQTETDLTRGKYFDEYFNVEDHWNIIPSVSKISVGRYVLCGFVFAAVGTINKIDKVGDTVAASDEDGVDFWIGQHHIFCHLHGGNRGGTAIV